MHYRVVLQGRTLGGADVEHVKREFIRVTGLPASVADGYFDGMPHQIKRQVSQADADRIAATLRAIGAAASVEREVADGEEDEGGGDIRIVANPLISGPPTIVPGMGGAAMSAPVVSPPRWLRQLRERLPLIVGVVVLAWGATLLAPIVDEFVQTVKPPPAQVAPARRPAPAEEAAAPADFNPALLHGPWRCTDQRTGLATYWTFEENGKLVYYGDTFKDGALVASTTADVPQAWKLSGDRLVFSYPGGEHESLAVQVLTLGNLRYGDARRRIEVDCRRP